MIRKTILTAAALAFTLVGALVLKPSIWGTPEPQVRTAWSPTSLKPAPDLPSGGYETV